LTTSAAPEKDSAKALLKELPGPTLSARAVFAKYPVTPKLDELALSVVWVKFGPVGEPVLVDVDAVGFAAAPMLTPVAKL
jgi:hypothetical protein